MPGLSQARGFTLLELMITVGIVGVLACVALPTWSHALHKARRTEARISLLGIQHAQERYYLNHLRYSDDLSGGSGLGLSGQSESGDYLLQIEASADGQRYIAVATAHPDGRQQGDRQCQMLMVNELGRRDAQDAGGMSMATRCW